MLKIGQVNLNTYDEPLYVFWSVGKGDFERIDIIKDVSKYQVINTSNCEAAYLRQGKERIFGKHDIIKKFLKIKHDASMIFASEQRDMFVEDGKVMLTITKEKPELSVKWSNTLKAGKSYKEYYQNEDGYILIEDITEVSNADFAPVNIDDYDVINEVRASGSTVTTRSNSEFLSYDDIMRTYPQLSHVLENDYVIALSYEEAESRLNEWINSKEQLKSFDIESLSTEWGVYSDNKITGVFLGLGETWSTYFPFRQDAFPYNLPIEFLETIFNAINNQPPAPEVILLAHNVKFEIEGFYQEFKKFVRFDFDTYLLAVIDNPIIRKGSHTLKNLTAMVDNRFYISLEQIFIGPVRFNCLPPEIVKIYGCPDATSPAKLYKYFMNKIPKDEHFIVNLEMQLPYVKAMNEFYGIQTQQELLNQKISDIQYQIDYLGSLFRQLHKTNRNINSTDVLREIMYDKLRCPVEVRTDTGAPAVSNAARKRIIEVGTLRDYDKTKIPKDILDNHGKVLIKGEDLASNRYPSLIIYQTYKKALKELGALNRIKNHSRKGKFMFYINQLGAGSSRQTSDAQQMSSEMKECMVADSPYHGMVSCDWSQVELRVLAWQAGQEDLVKLACNPGVDLHRAIYSIISKKPMWSISEEERQANKSVNFGVVYMMTEYGLAKKDYGPKYTKAELNEERKKITDFYNGLPHIKRYVKQNEVNLKRDGFIKTALGWYRYFPEVFDETMDPKRLESIVRSANNTPVQGLAAAMLKIVETKVFAYIHDKGWDKLKDYDGVMLPMVRMIVPIHDEILLSYDKSIPKEEIITMFYECMELDFEGAPPFFAAPAFIDNWLEGKNSANEIPIEFRDKIVEEFKKGNYLLEGRDYMEALNEWREAELSNYMMGLINQYKTPEEVAKHVKHDSLTHTLIETMIPVKKERKPLTHDERILEATRRYFNMLDNKEAPTVVVEDKDDTSYFQSDIELDTWIASYSHVDANGDLITEDIDEDDFVDEDQLEELKPVEEQITNSHVIYMMNQCWVDLTAYNIKTTGEAINQEIAKLANPDEFYEVVYIIGKTVLRSGLKVGYIEDKIEEIFQRVGKGEM